MTVNVGLTPVDAQHWYQDFQTWVNVSALLAFILSVIHALVDWYGQRLKLRLRVNSVPDGLTSFLLIITIDNHGGRSIRPEKVELVFTRADGAEVPVEIFSTETGFGDAERLEPGDFLRIRKHVANHFAKVVPFNIDSDFVQARFISAGEIVFKRSVSHELRESGYFQDLAKSKGPGQI